ncbi:hypothetical protein PtA15_6A338 [Puccinia triticina]|uniref:Uncharacterized protein n=1 Tax=Puccinia triticina TaxID=208348 RepID=A0ABY7CKF4_9BASI|nr:uncharacterized protein PtA15_6A338 [Puccinia triticina]WAQ85709.1 hypothetical protein PtA15_6A338 [Puccinia triticina]
MLRQTASVNQNTASRQSCASVNRSTAHLQSTPPNLQQYNPMRGQTNPTPAVPNGGHPPAAAQPDGTPGGNRNEPNGNPDSSDHDDQRSLPDEEGLYVRPLELEGLVQLDERQTQMLNRLLLTPPKGQWRVSMMTNMAILNQLANGVLGTEVVPPPGPIPPPVNPASRDLKTFVRIKIRELLTQGNLDAYSRTHLTGGVPINCTPLVLLTAFLAAQTPEFQAKQLPAGWLRNHVSNRSVLGMLRVLLKHERGNLRNLLLSNIKSSNRRPVDGPVPSLMQLIMIID